MLSGIYKTHKIPYNRTIEKKPAGCRMHDRQSDGMQKSKGVQETGKGRERHFSLRAYEEERSKA